MYVKLVLRTVTITMYLGHGLIEWWNLDSLTNHTSEEIEGLESDEGESFNDSPDLSEGYTVRGIVWISFLSAIQGSQIHFDWRLWYVGNIL